MAKLRCTSVHKVSTKHFGLGGANLKNTLADLLIGRTAIQIRRSPFCSVSCPPWNGNACESQLHIPTGRRRWTQGAAAASRQPGALLQQRRPHPPPAAPWHSTPTQRCPEPCDGAWPSQQTLGQ